jgi:hypothetical protein
VNISRRIALLASTLFAVAPGALTSLADGAEMRVPVTFSGGYETDPRDHGRPVALVAGGLGVKPEVFREAFRGVTPSPSGPPTREEARRNKDALLKVLGPLGITNNRLDEVSNYYRYRPQAGERWPTSPAKAEAIVEDGKIKRIVVADGGSGYNTPPKATVAGFENVPLVVKLRFAADLKRNGSVEIIDAAKP